MFTDAVWREKSNTFVQALLPTGEVVFWCCSRQMSTLPSYEEEARIVPNFGCACETCISLLDTIARTNNGRKLMAK